MSPAAEARAADSIYRHFCGDMSPVDGIGAGDDAENSLASELAEMKQQLAELVALVKPVVPLASEVTELKAQMALLLEGMPARGSKTIHSAN